MSSDIARALEDCRIWRPSALAEAVEIVSAATRLRAFSARLSTTLGVCLKMGEPHVATSDGERLLVAPDAIILRPPGCTWTSQAGRVGFLSLDLAASEWPADARFGRMTTMPQELLPELAHTLRVLRRASSLGAQSEAVTALVQALVDRGFVQSDVALEGEAVRQPDGWLARSRGPAPGWMGDGWTGGIVRRVSGDAMVRRAQECLREAIDRHVSLAELADRCGTSRFVLLRRFRRLVGLTPYAFQTQLRVDAARTMLARGLAPADVTFRTGFADQSHFGRRFKQVLGVTPAQYARQVRSVHAAPSP